MGCAESRNTVQPQGAFSVVTPGTGAAPGPSSNVASASNRLFNRNKNASLANKKHKPNALVPEPQGATLLSSVASGPRASLGDLVAATPPPEPHGAQSLSPSVDAIANAKPSSSPSTQTQIQPAPLAKGPSFLLLPADKQSLGHLTAEQLSIQFLKAVKNGDLAYMERVAQQAPKALHHSSAAASSLINIRGMWESTPLIYACQYCHPKAAMWLLTQGANVRLQNEKSVTPLLLASLEGMVDVVDWILKQYATPNSTTSASSSTDQQGTIASSEPGSSESAVSIDKQIGVVYNSAADLNIRLNPLLAAAMNGHVEIVAKLLAHKACVNFGVPASASVVSSKQFALLLAAKFGHASVVRILIKHGADFATSDASGSHALLLACEASKEECALELLRLLPATLPADDQSSAVASTSHSNACVVAWKQANSHGLTALHFAAANGLVSVVQSMLMRLQWGTDRDFVNATSVNRRESALLMACRKRQSEVVQLLITVGADFELADRGGTTALQVLKRDKKDELVKLCENWKLKGATELQISDKSRRNSETTTAAELAIEVTETSATPPLDDGALQQHAGDSAVKSAQAKTAAVFDWDAALEPIISPAVTVMAAPASDTPAHSVESNTPGSQIARDASIMMRKPIVASGSSRTMSFAPSAIRVTSGYEQQAPILLKGAIADGPLEESADTQQSESTETKSLESSQPPQAAVDGPKENDDTPSPKKERRKKKKNHHTSSKRGKQSSTSSLPALDLQLESNGNDFGVPAHLLAPESPASGDVLPAS